MTRLAGPKMTERMGQQIIVETARGERNAGPRVRRARGARRYTIAAGQAAIYGPAHTSKNISSIR